MEVNELQSETKGIELKAQHIKKSQHKLSADALPKGALVVLKGLRDAGFDAYVVGGWVRDSLLGFSPKDVDIVSNATPEQIKATFKSCRLIGRRFRLAHVYVGRELIEVATYRGHHAHNANNEISKSNASGQLVRDNVFGTIEEDAARRDFSFNAMYFDAEKEEILDFANGIDSLNAKSLALIGEHETRFTEDPVRMIRAVRFAVKLGFSIPENMLSSILKLGHLLATIPPARLFEETNKILLSGNGEKSLKMLIETKLLFFLFPTWKASEFSQDSKAYQLSEKMLANTDQRLSSNARITPAFLYASLLWYSLEEKANTLCFESGLSQYDAINIAGLEILSTQCKRVMIPKRFTISMREIWILQYRLSKRTGKKPFSLLSHPRFRAAYDFLLLRSEVEGGKLLELSEWWTTFQSADQQKRRNMVQPQRRRTKRSKKAGQ